MQAREQLVADMEGLRHQKEQLLSELGSTTRDEIAGAQAIRRLQQEVATLKSQALHHAAHHQVSLVLLTRSHKHPGSSLHILTRPKPYQNIGASHLQTVRVHSFDVTGYQSF
jgi:ElaB/YqjD/DUF883 family membrane-anchored ribosome-binding protein